ncbi:MAG TPA: IS4 family transposase [Magnetospirillum sp.]|nr:IS4 family transposase [Magnetospirillum sp.]
MPGNDGAGREAPGGIIPGRLREHTLCGLLMHSSLAVTTDGVPLGLAAVKFWTRDKFKGTAALKRKINPTRVPIETKESYRWLENLRQSTALFSDPGRCVHIGDRESDIYELFCLAYDLGTFFVVRVQTDRLAHLPEGGTADGIGGRVYQQMEALPWMGRHTVRIGGEAAQSESVSLAIKFITIETLPPIGKKKACKPQKLAYIHALEEREPEGRPRIDWRLVTNLPVTTLADATEKLSWYARRWKIEVFHKVMKSGCKAEDLKLRTAERLVKLLAIIAVVSWRIFWITMASRANPAAPPETALTPAEITILDRIIPPSSKPEQKMHTLAAYANRLARLGGYLNRSHDPPPGNLVMWRGISRLHDIAFGFRIAIKVMGN